MDCPLAHQDRSLTGTTQPIQVCLLAQFLTASDACKLVFSEQNFAHHVLWSSRSYTFVRKTCTRPDAMHLNFSAFCLLLYFNRCLQNGICEASIATDSNTPLMSLQRSSHLRMRQRSARCGASPNRSLAPSRSKQSYPRALRRNQVLLPILLSNCHVRLALCNPQFSGTPGTSILQKASVACPKSCQMACMWQ